MTIWSLPYRPAPMPDGPVATMVGRARRARRLHGRATEKPPRTRKRASGGTYATAYDACTEIANFQIAKRSTKVALRVQSHVACLLVMFCFGRLAMPCMRRDDVRHATLLFSAVGGCAHKAGKQHKGNKQCIARNADIKLMTQRGFAQNVERR